MGGVSAVFPNESTTPQPVHTTWWKFQQSHWSTKPITQKAIQTYGDMFSKNRAGSISRYMSPSSRNLHVPQGQKQGTFRHTPGDMSPKYMYPGTCSCNMSPSVWAALECFIVLPPGGDSKRLQQLLVPTQIEQDLFRAWSPNLVKVNIVNCAYFVLPWSEVVHVASH